MSRAHVKSKKNRLSSLTKITNHQRLYHFVRELKIPGFAPREFLTLDVWKKQGRTLVVMYESTDHTDFPPIPAFVRGETTSYWEYETLSKVGRQHQTRATLTLRNDLKGSIPKSFVDKGVARSLMSLSATRKQFDKSLEIDGATRARNVAMIAEHVAEYSGKENSIIEEGANYFSEFEGMKAKNLKVASPLTKAKIAYNGGDHHAWGWSSTTVRAGPAEVLAYIIDLHKHSGRYEDDVEKDYVEKLNDHNTLAYVKKRSPNKIVRDRDFLSRGVWKREQNGSLLYVMKPEESAESPPSEDTVRAQYPSAIRLSRRNGKETTLAYVAHPDAGGLVPNFITDRFLGVNLGYVTEIQEYFQALRGLDEWDVEDGTCVAEGMVKKTEAEKRHEWGETTIEARMRELFLKQKGLGEIAEK